ncbi:MAG: 4-(cytidine 5'-diphospho)-2-C-methyl-D-erythritol kinase [Candidatus Omnitrophica bacterium]|nr:4-(cytidine 5'-diphospho)-2-C-methyl-D-erythritol kinase [Candidatus Omnitrophota bacterium]
MSRITVPSFAKLNLFLSVRRKRADGFHAIRTLFERISLHDTITLTTRRDNRITVSSDNPALNRDSNNLALTAALLLQKTYAVKQGAAIRIEKRIPLGSGMGGGSSNAAATLLGLNRLWKVKASRAALVKLGARIGSDVPFFVHECTYAWGTGRGERVRPLQELAGVKLRHVIVMPGIAVSTPRVYAAWDRRRSLRLTRPGSGAKLTYLALKKNHPALLSGVISNSLEPVTESMYPQVSRAKAALSAQGVKTIMMSGSGPAVFGIVNSRKEADQVRSHLGKSRLYGVFCATSI